MVRVFSHGFQVPSSAAVATSETGAFFSCLLGFKTCCSFLWVASPLSLGWAELMQVMWYLHSYQVTEQWTSCAGQEAPDMLSTIINQLQPSPQLCYSKNAWNSISFTSQNPVFYICNKAEQLFNVLSEFSSLKIISTISTSVSSSIFFKMDFFEGTPLETEVRLLFSLILLTSHLFHCTQTELIHWHVIKICWRNLNML